MLLPAAVPAHAKWAAELAYAGFMGTAALGPIYEWRQHHDLSVSLGAYQNGGRKYPQLNFIYRYAHWRFERPNVLWKPLHVGVFAIYTLDQDRFFATTPEKYPEDGYYDQTALRAGFEIGTTVVHLKSGLAFASYLRLLDNGMIALLNNVHRDLQYYSSSGVAIQYHFR